MFAVKGWAALFLNLLASVVATSAIADPGRGGWGSGDHMFGVSGWGGMMFGPLMMIIWMVGVVALVMIVLRWFGVTNSTSHATRRDASDILKERFARGEINEKEFKAMLGQIRG